MDNVVILIVYKENIKSIIVNNVQKEIQHNANNAKMDFYSKTIDANKLTVIKT